MILLLQSATIFFTSIKRHKSDHIKATVEENHYGFTVAVSPGQVTSFLVVVPVSNIWNLSVVFFSSFLTSGKNEMFDSVFPTKASIYLTCSYSIFNQTCGLEECEMFCFLNLQQQLAVWTGLWWQSTHPICHQGSRGRIMDSSDFPSEVTGRRGSSSEQATLQ